MPCRPQPRAKRCAFGPTAVPPPAGVQNPVGVLGPPDTALPLAESDVMVTELLSGKLGAGQVSSLLQTESFARRVAATVDSLTQAQAPVRVWPVHPTPQRFLVDGEGAELVAASANAARYAAMLVCQKLSQKDIFEFIFNFGTVSTPATAAINLMQQINAAPNLIERETPRISKTDEKFLESIKLSYDNENYENFTRLKSYAERQEQFFINEKTKTKLSLYRFLPILPIPPSIKPPKKVFVSYSHQNNLA